MSPLVVESIVASKSPPVLLNALKGVLLPAAITSLTSPVPAVSVKRWAPSIILKKVMLLSMPPFTVTSPPSTTAFVKLIWLRPPEETMSADNCNAPVPLTPKSISPVVVLIAAVTVVTPSESILISPAPAFKAPAIATVPVWLMVMFPLFVVMGPPALSKSVPVLVKEFNAVIAPAAASTLTSPVPPAVKTKS